MTNRKENDHNRTTILEQNIIIPADQQEQYVDIPFSVPKYTDTVRVRASYRVKDGFPLMYAAFLDPLTFRGWQVIEIEDGAAEYDLWVSPSSSARGCIPGSIPAGEWCLRLDIKKLKEPVEVSIHGYCETGHPTGARPAPYFDKRIINGAPGW